MYRHSRDIIRTIFLRRFCSTKKEESSPITEKKESSLTGSRITYGKLLHPSKVPFSPVFEQEYPIAKIEIDSKTIQLLERLSLVDLGSKEALKTLQDSIEFANRIVNIDTEGVEPLYTVLEDQILELREDAVTEGNIKENILRNAQLTEEDYFVAPPGNIPLATEEKNFK